MIGFSLNSLLRRDERKIWLLSAGLASAMSSDICPFFRQKDEVFEKNLTSRLSLRGTRHAETGQHCSERTFPIPSFQHSHVQLLQCFAIGPLVFVVFFNL